MYKRILLAVDESEYSKDAEKTALGLASSLDASLIVFSAIDMDLVAATGYTAPDKDLEAELRKRCEALTDRIAKTAESKGIHVETVVQKGSPGEAIVRYAKEANADLIVMGSHGLGGFKKMIVGSVADYVVRSANVPVLVVKHQ